MIRITEMLVIASHEIKFQTSRSGGPGGQNVNKLETRVELVFDVANSNSLNDKQRELLTSNLRSKLDSGGVLHIVSQESRSQWQNKQLAIEKFIQMLRSALQPRKKRVATRPTRSSKDKRLQSKKKKSEKKQLRRRPYD